jgi:hypothetical protein
VTRRDDDGAAVDGGAARKEREDALRVNIATRVGDARARVTELLWEINHRRWRWRRPLKRGRSVGQREPTAPAPKPRHGFHPTYNPTYDKTRNCNCRLRRRGSTNGGFVDAV